MENFKIWIMSLCGATAISAIFKLLLSESSLKKTINVFFSIFILFYTVIPAQYLFKNNIDLNFQTDVAYDEYYQDGYEIIISQAITNLCDNLGVKVLSIDIDSYIDDEGYINVNGIILNTDSKNPQSIKTEIEKKLGFEVQVK